MITTIDRAGRLVIPKPIREQAALRPGEPLRVVCRDGRIEIEPAPREVRIRQRQGFRVAEPAGSYEALEQSEVRRTRERLRDER